MKETLIKRFFAGVLALIMLLSVTAVASAQTTEYFGNDGFAVPNDANVDRALSGETAEAVKLVPVASENSLMTVLGRTYVRENREGVDLSFPIWTNDCGALRFLGDELWLVTNELELLTSYDGLYISEGRTYTDEYGQADPDEFIFVRVSDSLYINTQSATLVTLLGEYPIQSNSVLKMTSDYMSWFSPDGEYLAFDRNTTLYDAKLRIGENEYDYHDLLEVLGLINAATDKLSKGQNADDELNEAMDILGIEKEYKKKTDTRDNKSGEIVDAKAKEKEIESEPAEAESEELTEDAAAEGSGGDAGSESNSGDGGVVPEESLPPVPEESAKTTPTPTPKPSPTEQPTEEPSPTVLPSGTPSPSPSAPATNTPSPSETPETTETPIPTGSASPTVKPTKLPGPTSSSSPTLNPSIVPVPSNTVAPTHSAVPTAETSGTPIPTGSVIPQSPDPEESGEPMTPEPTTHSHTTKPSSTPKTPGSSTPAPTPTGPTPVPTNPPYIMPTVNVSDIEVWSYAVNGKLVVTDTQNNIVGKIRVAVYRRLSDGSFTGETYEGHRIFTAKKGLSSVGGRRSFTGSSEFTISPIPPDTTLYLQYTYSYNEVTIENGERKTVRRTMNSSFYEFTTLPCDSTNVKFALSDWDIDFAAATDGIVLRNFTLTNSTNYNSDDTSFANFKKDTLPYITRIKLTAQKRVDDTDRDKSAAVGSPVEIYIGSTAIKKAKTGATVFTSTTPKLDSNSYYTFTVTALDKFGNAIPMLVNNSDTADSSFFEDFYTAKAAPTVTFTEVKNVADKYTVCVTVNDPDGALMKDDDNTIHDLHFTASTPEGVAAELNGTWKDDTVINPDSEHPITELALKNPTDGATYEFTLDTLAFAQTYYLRVSGDYSPQPDPAVNINTQLEAQYNVEFGKSRCFTASLSTGLVGFLTSFPVDGVKDTYLTIESKMNELTTTNILPLVDQFKYSITTESGTEVFSYVLDMEKLNVLCDSKNYNAEERALIIEAGDSNTPQVMIAGDWSDFNGKTIWETMLASSYYDDVKDKDIYTNGQTVRIIVQKDKLVSKTNYNFSITPIVKKSGRDYTIPTSLTSTSFTTRRIQPVKQCTDFIVASGKVIYKNFRIDDPDETIKSDGLVYAKLIYKETENPTTIRVKEIYANSQPEDLVFEGIIEGAKYSVEFYAEKFNDTELGAYIQNDKLLFEPVDSFKGNEDLNGSITLTALDYTDKYSNDDVIWSRSGPVALDCINKTESGEITDDKLKWLTDKDFYTTEFIELPLDVNFVEYGGGYPSSYVNKTFGISFYDRNYSNIDWYDTTYAATRLIPVPDTAKYCKIYIPHTKEALNNEGIILLGYKTEKDNIFTNAAYSSYIQAGKTITANGALADDISTNSCVYMLPVTAGEVFTRSGGGAIYCYGSDGTYRGYYDNSALWRLTIPNGVSYISFGGVETDKAELYKVYNSDALTQHGYTASFDIAVKDATGKLENAPKAKLSLYDSETMRKTYYAEEPLREIELKLVKDSTDEKGLRLILDPGETEQIFKNLNPNCGFELVLTVDYNGEPIELDSVEFRTDSSCKIVYTNAELDNAIAQNPYANIIVASDFEHNVSSSRTFYGTIDFQGHTITRKSGFSGYLVKVIGYGASVTNLVYKYPADANISHQLFYDNFGLVENVIIRTDGAVTMKSSMLMYCNRAAGTVRNFIYRIDGDLTDSGSGSSLLANYNWGLIENGYVYTVNNSGITLTYDNFLLVRRSFSQTKHVYVISDFWLVPNDSGTFFNMVTGNEYVRSYNNTLTPNSGIYVVGDYYKMGEVKNKRSPLSELVMFRYAPDNKDIYYISERTYTKRSDDTVTRKADYQQLRDQDWQDSVLGSAFDTSVVTLDEPFYPRLKMPDCMMIHQEYISIGTGSVDETPTLVDDELEKTKTVTNPNNEAYVRLSFENKSKLPISSVTITGLDVVKKTGSEDLDIENLGVQDDGLYDVLVHVKVSATSPKYASSYKITEFKWMIDSTRDGKTDKSFSYTTHSLEFWKEIDEPDDWAAINNDMGANYKLIADITFPSGYPMQKMTINGSQATLSGTSDFTGKIDGGGFTIKGLKIENVDYPYVVYRMNSKNSYIKNLFIDGLTISNYDDGTQSRSFAGFVGELQYGLVDNVHISNSSLTADGDIGLIVGHGGYGDVQNCSVTDSTVTQRGTTYGVNCGAMVGRLQYGGAVRNSYVSGVTVTCTESPAAISVGGLAGFVTYNVYNCYAEGEIYASSNSVGGVVGQVPSAGWGGNAVTGCWSYVTITNDKGVTGGIAGVCVNSASDNNLALGDVFGVSGSAHRTNGKGSTAGYAYKGQAVTGVDKGKLDTARMLLNADELKSASGWVDVAKLGDAYDYEKMYDEALQENKYCPQLLSTEGKLLPNQKNIFLPGESTEPKLEVTNAKYDTSSSTESFIISLTLRHPGVISSDIVSMYDNNSPQGLCFSIEGIDIAQSQIPNNVTIEVSQGTEKDSEGNIITTNALITVKKIDNVTLTRAKDNYSVTVKYPVGAASYEANTVVDFGTPIYWEISSVSDWNDVMSKGHDKTSENFLITGNVVFENNHTDYTGLKLNRLEAEAVDANGKPIYGFENLTYAPTGDDAEPWIKATGAVIKNLRFKNFDVNYATPTETTDGVTTQGLDVTWDAAGVISTANGAQNCVIDTFTYDCSDSGIGQTIGTTHSVINCNTASYGGFFGKVFGNLTNIYMNNVTINVENGGSYIGALAGYQDGGGLINVVANTIKITAENGNSYVNGILGYNANDALNGTTQNSVVSVDGLTLKTKKTCCGISYNVGYPVKYTVKNFEIESTNGDAYGGDGNYPHYTVVDIEEGKITGNSAYGFAYDSLARDTLIKNVEITARSGNAAGIDYCTYNHDRCTVEGCTIKAGKTGNTAMAAGCTIHSGGGSNRYFNSCKVIDTEIESYGRAAGIFAGPGDKTYAYSFDRCYVGSDVTVTSHNAAAGGITGQVRSVNITNCICGATVTSENSKAGGLVGEVAIGAYDALPKFTITNSAFNGTVTAKTHAAGLIGYVDITDQRPTVETFKGIIVAGSISGNPASLWINNVNSVATAGDAKISFNAATLVNGSTPESLREGEKASSADTVHNIFPESGTIVDNVADYNTQSFYTDLGWSTSYWSFAHLGEGNTKMPYTRSNASGSPAMGPNGTGDVLIPDGLSSFDDTTVYVSGADSVNIETKPEAWVDYEIKNGSGAATNHHVQANSYGVITLKFNFADDDYVKVKGNTYNGKDLRRTVMTYGSNWYYIDEGDLRSKKDSDAHEEGDQDVILNNVVNIWRGEALCSDGTLYDVSNITNPTAKTREAADSDKCLKCRPLYSYTSKKIPGGDAEIQVYNFSTVVNQNKKSSIYSGRIFICGSNVYSIPPTQQVLNDGIVFKYFKGVTQEINYYALLGKNNVLNIYGDNMELGELSKTGIIEISNNFDYDNTVLMAQYSDGVVAVDYSVGTTLVNTRPAGSTIRGYALNMLRSVFSSNSVSSGNGTLFSSSGTDSALTGSASPTLGSAAPQLAGATYSGDGTANGNGTESVNGTKDTNGTANANGTLNTKDNDKQSTLDGGKGNEGTGDGGAVGAAVPVKTASTAVDGKTGENVIGAAGAIVDAGTGSTEGKNPVAASAASTAPTAASPAPVESAMPEASPAVDDKSDAAGTADGKDEAEDAESEEEKKSEEKKSEEEEDEASTEVGLWYVPNEGITDDGELVLSEDDSVSYVPGEGVYVDGDLCYVEDEARMLSGISGGAGASAAPALDDLSSAGLEVMVYDAESDKFVSGTVKGTVREVIGKNEDGTPKLAPEAEPETIVEDSTVKEPDAKLNVNHGFGRSLTTTDRGGVTLILIVTGAFLVLVAVYLIRRKE